MHRGSHGSYIFDDSDHDFDYDPEPMKDLTACDKECGYCSHCYY